MKPSHASLVLALLAASASVSSAQTEQPQAPSEARRSQQAGAGAQAPAAAPDGTAAPAQEAAAAPASVEQLEQLVAPIALYPDALLAQLLMAATYPLEIVEAARWVQKNPKVTGDKLEAALKEQTWDPSVKSLCAFPDVLKRMNENLDWTQALGDAFLAQKAELMDSVQNMRRKAYEAGNLKSGKEQTVTEREDKIIVIESAQPEVIYVPTYYPTAVYGGWGYPYYYYPPMYPPPPAGGAFFGFAAGMFWGAAIWGGCSWGWGHTDVDIDINRQNNFIDRTEVDARRQQVKDRSGAASTRDTARNNKSSWQHDPSHRKGVGYKDGATAKQFGASNGQTRVTRDQARGYGDRAATRPSTSDRAATRPTTSNRPSTRDTAGARPSTSNRQATSRPSTGTSARTTGQRSSSFSGSRNTSLDRASSARGSSSRGSAGSRASSGSRSGARSGGGRGGGGRGGGGRR
jgi:uncharacterized membrane protein YgcG